MRPGVDARFGWGASFSSEWGRRQVRLEQRGPYPSPFFEMAASATTRAQPGLDLRLSHSTEAHILQWKSWFAWISKHGFKTQLETDSNGSPSISTGTAQAAARNPNLMHPEEATRCTYCLKLRPDLWSKLRSTKSLRRTNSDRGENPLNSLKILEN